MGFWQTVGIGLVLAAGYYAYTLYKQKIKEHEEQGKQKNQSSDSASTVASETPAAKDEPSKSNETSEQPARKEKSSQKIEFNEITRSGLLTVERIHAPGSGKKAQIAIQDERKVGSGQFANVYKARMTVPTTRLIAIKKLWPKPDQIEMQKREIELLREINHPQIVTFLYYFERKVDDDQTIRCLVFDYMPSDAAALRSRGVRFDLLDAKLYSYQLFLAVAHLQKLKIVHLDIKPSNLLVDHENGLLKLADFGSARKEMPKEPNPYQVTRYYRPPELLFGSNVFSCGIDIWSAGCVVYDFVTNNPLFKAIDNNSQARLIIEVLGYPSEPEIKAMGCKRPRFGKPTARGLAKYTQGNIDEACLSLMQQIFVYGPAARAKPNDILKHHFFDALKTDPSPTREDGRVFPPLFKSAASESA